MKIQNVSNFYYEERAAKITHIFHFLMGRYFLMGASIFMNVSAFLETSVGFLKSAVLQLFPKYSQSYAYLNAKVGQKIGRFFSVSHLDVTCKTL